jgi:hypothetical protein
MRSSQHCFKLWLISLFMLVSVNALSDDAWQNASGWWNATDIPAFDKNKISQPLPLITLGL